MVQFERIKNSTAPKKVYIITQSNITTSPCAAKHFSYHDAVHSRPLCFGSWSIPELGANVRHASARLVDQHFSAATATTSWRPVPDHGRKHRWERRVVESGDLVGATSKHVAPSFWPIAERKLNPNQMKEKKRIKKKEYCGMCTNLLL